MIHDLKVVAIQKRLENLIVFSHIAY